jgi:hypothetical protein
MWITVGCVVAAFGLLFVVPALTPAPAEDFPAQANPSTPTKPASESALASVSSAHSVQLVPTSPQPVDDRSTPTEARVEPVATPESAVKSIRMFPPFPNESGRIKWKGFDLPVVPASRDNVRAYLIRMREFYDEFDRADRCRTQQERTEQAGRFIIDCDSMIGFDGVVVPDSHVEWTKLFVQVIQIRAESMYLPWGVAETDFRVKHKEAEIHAQANELFEALTKSHSIR